MHDALLRSLQDISFFQHFDEEQIQALIARGTTQEIPAHTVLFHQGDNADSMYVILAGAVKVVGEDAQGVTFELSQLQAGDFFGELALIDGGTRSATIETLENSSFFMLGREVFIQMLTQSPGLLSEILADISGKIRTSNEKVYQEILEQQKIQSEMELERHRSLSQMVAGVAHEINTPLGIVNVTASMITENLNAELLDRIENAEVRETLEDLVEAAQLMQNNIARANKLIQTFKNISVGQITDTLETLMLPQLLEEIVDLFKVQARLSGLKIKLETSEAITHGQWTGYSGYLTQVMLNLLTNIERYAYPNKQGGEVNIVLKNPEGKGFELEICDYGNGMSEADCARVFDVFFTTGRGQGGTGLGMSIVHSLVTSALQGDIQLQSMLGQGTTIRIKLPQHIDNDTSRSEL
jgi:signal transduction histidine kinase